MSSILELVRSRGGWPPSTEDRYPDGVDPRRTAIGLLVASGTLAGHTIGYRLAGGGAWSAEGAHGYLGPVTAIVVPAAILGFLVLAVSTARSVTDTPVRLRTLLALQFACFLGQEAFERIAAGQSHHVHTLLAEPAIILGLVAQVVVATALWVAVWAGRHVARRLLGTERTLPEPFSPAPLGAATVLPALAYASPVMLRGPPRPL